MVYNNGLSTRCITTVIAGAESQRLFWTLCYKRSSARFIAESSSLALELTVSTVNQLTGRVKGFSSAMGRHEVI